jgi:hypothetical protein
MTVKKPDSRETTSERVLLALDTHVPPSMAHHTAVLEDALDALVESWLSLSQRLLEDGRQVTMVVRARGEDGHLHDEQVHCHRANHRELLDLGARVEWQSDRPIEEVLASVSPSAPALQGALRFDSVVVVSTRLTPPPPLPMASSATWIYLHPRDALGPPPKTAYQLWRDHDGVERRGLRALARFIALPHPAGSDDNSLLLRMRRLDQVWEERQHQVELRRLIGVAGDRAWQAMIAGDAAAYRVELGPKTRLLGVKGRTRAEQSSATAAADGTRAARGGVR